MGGGTWTEREFASYSMARGRGVTADGAADIKNLSASQVYTQHYLNAKLNPKGVIRECVDSEEHPNTIPVILALDVTGSMGQTAVEVAAELNKIMTKLYEEVQDVEFMIMGIGDLYCDDAPLQVSQFESDIRIAEQLDQLWFEFGGGGNLWESYTAPWAFGISQIQLDCWKRGKKGIIITMGDEELNPELDIVDYNNKVSDSEHQFNKNIDTKELYNLAKDKFSIYHINVKHGYRDPDMDRWYDVLGKENVITVPVAGVAQAITDIVLKEAKEPVVKVGSGGKVDENGYIEW